MGHVYQPRAFEADVTPQGMAAWIMRYCPISDSEALKLLRARFPDRPLSLRAAALGFLAYRQDASATAPE